MTDWSRNLAESIRLASALAFSRAYFLERCRNSDRSVILTLSDGRKVTVGASLNQDTGVWLLHDAPLLRWLTPGDARQIGLHLAEFADYLEYTKKERTRGQRH